jgi:asparagine synthase (glutamine-hydrolysing)
MCGIAGILSRQGPADNAVIREMSQVLCHRGPDDEGFQTLGPASFGFRRLSIIDLGGGHQPFTSDDGRVSLVFNGEIYNFESLREKLEATGRHKFKTRSDTEVLLRLYEEYGEDCLQHLRGMFAFAIWDDRKRTLFAARDRFGKKPFFYFLTPAGDLVFASELKSLVKHPQCPRQIDLQAINLYLSIQYIPAPKTIFQKVFKLPAAFALRWTPQSGTSTFRYWDVRYEPKESISYDEAKTRLRHRLFESVKLRMISDVPLGAYLSGGVDSSIIVAVMAQLSSTPIKTFSIGFDEEAYTELPYARDVAQRYKTDHHEFIVRPELTDVLPKLAWFYSEPFADSSALPSYYLARETRKHVTVALTGDGGDETFAGYLRYRAMWALKWWNLLPDPARESLAKASQLLPVSEAPIGWSWRIQRLLKVGAMPTVEQYGRTLEYFHREELDELWAPEHRHVLNESAASSNAMFAETLAAYAPKDRIDELMYLDLHHYLPDCLMVKTDVASMANSLEARSPLLDSVLVEEVARWPVSWKYRPPNGSKRIFKDTFAQDLPPSILARGKQGFGVPISQWFRGPLKDYLREALLSPKALARGYFRRDTLERYIAEHQSGKRDRCYGLWALLMLELWHQQFMDSSPAPHG